MNTLTDITEKAQSDISKAFYESAQINAEASDGLLVAYEPDFERFPYMSLSFRDDRRRVEGNPIEPIDVFGVLSTIDDRCEGLEDAIESSSGITLMQRVLESGQNVVEGTDHQEIADIAYLAAGSSAVLRKRNVLHRSALVLSKAASDYLGVNVEKFGLPVEQIKEFLGAFGLEVLDDNTVPVREFLKLAVDTQYLVIPNTASFASLRGIQQDAVEAHNRKVKDDIAGAFSRRGIRKRPPVKLSIAMPGTKNKPLDINKYWENLRIPGFHVTIPEHLPTSADQVSIIGKIATGICDYAHEGLAFPTTVRLSKDRKPIVRIDPDFDALLDEDRIHSFAGKLIDLVDNVDGTTSVYDVKGNLPIKK